jgi:DNA-binding Lrp family transcriptional regulator
MDMAVVTEPSRRPRFRRASEPPAFRVTDDDVQIVRELARYRFLRSSHIAALVGRSLDRTNDRLMRLFHAGYIDRPRAQLDYYPTSGSAPMIYALADRGARLLVERDGVALANVEWSRRNHEAGRPFIEHQIEIVNFSVALQSAVRGRPDLKLVSAIEMNASLRQALRTVHARFALRAKLSRRGIAREISVVPDFVFVVEIDRGTMPVTRADIEQTSFARKMRVYLAAHAAKQHEQQFGWDNFRVLTITTDWQRIHSMIDAVRSIHIPHSVGASLFWFGTFAELRTVTPLIHLWRRGDGRKVAMLNPGSI